MLSRMAFRATCETQRQAAVLVWLPLLVAFPLFDLSPDAVTRATQLAGLALIVASTVVAVLTSRPAHAREQRPVTYAALASLVPAATLATRWGAGWETLWILVAIVAPAVLRGWSLVVLETLLVTAMATAGWYDGVGAGLWTSVGGLVLAAAATTSFLRLMEAVSQLQRTRDELARVAVAEERERFSRDLHDLLGHTLSVMVVKAEAVRRLVGQDPAQAAAQAADIEQVGRQALAEVRDAVDGMRTATLTEALAQARQVLDSARITTEVVLDAAPLPPASDEALAWVVREATTNVLRHSGADSCRIEVLREGAHARLTVSDDGVGGPHPPDGSRVGGLDGLRRRLEAAGGALAVQPGPDGFRLVASVPGGSR